MTGATQFTPAVREAAAAAAGRLRSQGWEVVSEPGAGELPPALADVRPDLVARRGDEHLVVQVKSRRMPPNMDTVVLAERVGALPGWRLELVYVPEAPLTADREELSQRALRAYNLAKTDPEAALLLAWSAVEGLLHRLAEGRGLDTDAPGALLSALASLGVIDEAEHRQLREAWEVRNALAHGRQGPTPDKRAVQRLSDLAQLLAERSTSAQP